MYFFCSSFLVTFVWSLYKVFENSPRLMFNMERCDYCGATFSSVSNLNRHALSFHKRKPNKKRCPAEAKDGVKDYSRVGKQWKKDEVENYLGARCHDPRRVQRSEKRTKSCKYDIVLFFLYMFFIVFFSLFHRIHFIVFSVDRAKLQENCYRVNVFPRTSINELCISCALI